MLKLTKKIFVEDNGVIIYDGLTQPVSRTISEIREEFYEAFPDKMCWLN